MIDLILARQHLKADNEAVEDDLIEQYIASATSACEGYCNRKFYETLQQKTDDYPVALADLQNAIDARDTAIEAATNDEVKSVITNDYIAKRGAVLARCNGVVIDDTITAAILMMLGHFYCNRQEVVVSQYSGATQLPAGAKRILEPYLWVGDLGGMQA